MPTRPTVLSLAALLGFFSLPGLLQADLPGRAARVNYFQGPLSFRPAALDDWVPPSTNYPLTSGDELVEVDTPNAAVASGRGRAQPKDLVIAEKSRSRASP